MARRVFLRVCPHTVNQNRGRNVPCEKERKTGKDPQPGGVLRARPFWQACVLRYKRRQPAARQERGFVLVWPAKGESRWETAKRLRVAEEELHPAGKGAMLAFRK